MLYPKSNSLNDKYSITSVEGSLVLDDFLLGNCVKPQTHEGRNEFKNNSLQKPATVVASPAPLWFYTPIHKMNQKSN